MERRWVIALVRGTGISLDQHGSVSQSMNPRGIQGSWDFGRVSEKGTKKERRDICCRSSEYQAGRGC